MRNFLIAALTVFVTATPAGAVDRAISYLSQEPVTLLDWGLNRLQLDLDRAAHQPFEAFSADETRAGAFYEWRTGRIVGYVTLATRYDLRTPENCKATFRAVVDHLTLGAPVGATRAGWYLETIFSHIGRRGAQRPQDMPEQLTRIVRLEVALRAREQEHSAGDWMRVSCAGPLNAAAEAIDVTFNGAIQ